MHTRLPQLISILVGFDLSLNWDRAQILKQKSFRCYDLKHRTSHCTRVWSCFSRPNQFEHLVWGWLVGRRPSRLNPQRCFHYQFCAAFANTQPVTRLRQQWGPVPGLWHIPVPRQGQRTPSSTLSRAAPNLCARPQRKGQQLAQYLERSYLSWSLLHRYLLRRQWSSGCQNHRNPYHYLPTSSAASSLSRGSRSSHRQLQMWLCRPPLLSLAAWAILATFMVLKQMCPY